jgi:hypothetical protein
MRDGAFGGGKLQFYRGYCSLTDWIAAGNKDPRDTAENMAR